MREVFGILAALMLEAVHVAALLDVVVFCYNIID
jgi:hypothetical protein